MLGTLTVGYRLTDALAEELARLAQCEVVLLAGPRSRPPASRTRRTPMRRGWSREVASAIGVLPQLRRIGDHEYVGGIFPLRQAADDPGGRLLLLADWQPTQLFVDRLRERSCRRPRGVRPGARRRLIFSRRVSQPLRDIAAAAADIAGGNLSLQLPVRGSAEAGRWRRRSTR